VTTLLFIAKTARCNTVRQNNLPEGKNECVLSHSSGHARSTALVRFWGKSRSARIFRIQVFRSLLRFVPTPRLLGRTSVFSRFSAAGKTLDVFAGLLP